MRIAIAKEAAEWPLVLPNGFLGTHDLCGNDPLHVAALHSDPCVIDSSKTTSQVLNIGNAVRVHFLHGIRLDQAIMIGECGHTCPPWEQNERLYCATPVHRSIGEMSPSLHFPDVACPYGHTLMELWCA